MHELYAPPSEMCQILALDLDSSFSSHSMFNLELDSVMMSGKPPSPLSTLRSYAFPNGWFGSFDKKAKI
jgi:hypothetical protein